MISKKFVKSFLEQEYSDNNSCFFYCLDGFGVHFLDGNKSDFILFKDDNTPEGMVSLITCTFKFDDDTIIKNIMSIGEEMLELDIDTVRHISYSENLEPQTMCR